MDKKKQNPRLPFWDVPDYLVSARMFENKLIKDYIAASGTIGVCHYSGKRTKVLPLESVVEYINNIVSVYYGNPGDEGIGWDFLFDGEKEDEYSEYSEHYDYKKRVRNAIRHDRRVYTDMGDLLRGKSFVADERVMEDIVGSFGDICLVRRTIYDDKAEDEYSGMSWKDFAGRTNRMAAGGTEFGDILKAEEKVLGKLAEAITSAEKHLLKRRGLRLYRSVQYDDAKEPPVEFSDLTSPPGKYAAAGRMNRAGESVFYGTGKRSDAKAEILNDLLPRFCDGHVYTGKFEARHDLLLLDLRYDKLYRAYHPVSIFNQPRELYNTLLFLDSFYREISGKDENSNGYVPTQLVTAFLRKRLEPDGILYDHPKNPDGFDAVLFFDNENSGRHLRLAEYEVVHKRMFRKYSYPQNEVVATWY